MNPIGKQFQQNLWNEIDLQTTLLLPQKKPDTNIFISANRFTPIAPTNEVQPMDTVETQSVINNNKTSKPPLIFIQEQINYNNFSQKINELTSGFDSKSSTKGLKLQTYSPDSYRSVIKYLKNNVSFNSYQSKKEKPYRVVIRNIHHSTDTSFIKQELLNKGFVTRNIMPVIHKLTNTPYRSSLLISNKVQQIPIFSNLLHCVTQKLKLKFPTLKK